MLADQGSATVAGASVLAAFASGAVERFVKLKEWTQSGCPEVILALIMSNQIEFYLLHYHLVLALLAVLVLAPAGGDAVVPDVVLLSGTVKLALQTDRVNVLAQLHGLLEDNDGKVVVEVLLDVSRMHDNVAGIAILVEVGLRLLLGVPLSAPDMSIGNSKSAEKRRES